MGIVKAEICSVENLLDLPLTIPEYQRPYRWTQENVFQLLQDILQSWKEGRNSYRIGSVILYNNTKANQNDIVDGQQRITTLLLILNRLNSKTGIKLLDSLTYNHIDSKNAIVNNSNTINNWLYENIQNDYREFEIYITKHCNVVRIEVDDLSEAFQMFDSQNGTGKELEAYNLLKAFHIRAMELNTFEEKVQCDKTWESATRFAPIKDNLNCIDLLFHLFEEQLYRTRIWSKKKEALQFNKKQINEFKGLSLSENIKFPFQNKLIEKEAMQHFLKLSGMTVKGLTNRFNYANFENINPILQINDDIINGKLFFEYIETYVEIYKQLFIDKFDNKVLVDFKVFFDEATTYIGSNRTGDRFLLELYKSLIFLVFDRFGENGLNKYYKTFFKLVYRFRLEKKQVKYKFLSKDVVTNELFYLIENAKSYMDLQPIEQLANKEVNCVFESDELLQTFSNLNIMVSTTDKDINLKQYSELWQQPI